MGKVVPNLRLLGPDFPETETEMRSQDEKCTQGKTKDHKLVFFNSIDPQGSFTSNFGFALPVALPMLTFFIKSRVVRIRSSKSSELCTQFCKLWGRAQVGMKHESEGKLGPKSRMTPKIAPISASNLHFQFLHLFWCFCGVKFLQISHPCMI